MDELVKAIFRFSRDVEAATGKQPTRIELPNAEHCIRFYGIELWCDSSLAARIFLEQHPSLKQKLTTEEGACL